jgi:hypothetical protein
MASLREKIIRAVVQKLETLSSVEPLRVYRSRETPLAPSEPAIIVRKRGEEALGELNDRRIDFAIEVYAWGDEAETDADVIECEVHKTLMADRTLGGACLVLIAGDTEWTRDEADRTVNRTIMNFSARYRAKLEDLSAPAFD